MSIEEEETQRRSAIVSKMEEWRAGQTEMGLDKIRQVEGGWTERGGAGLSQRRMPEDKKTGVERGKLSN